MKIVLQNPLLHTMSFPIRWGELDVLGHVNNAQYLRYFEESRTAWCEVIGRPLRNTGEGMILLKAGVTYKKPVGYPASVVVELKAGRIGNTSFELVNTLVIPLDIGTDLSMLSRSAVQTVLIGGTTSPCH